MQEDFDGRMPEAQDDVKSHPTDDQEAGPRRSSQQSYSGDDRERVDAEDEQIFVESSRGAADDFGGT